VGSFVEGKASRANSSRDNFTYKRVKKKVGERRFLGRLQNRWKIKTNYNFETKIRGRADVKKRPFEGIQGRLGRGGGRSLGR